MTVNGPEFPTWLVKLVEKIPEPSAQTLETVYGLLIFSMLTQLVVSILMAING